MPGSLGYSSFFANGYELSFVHLHEESKLREVRSRRYETKLTAKSKSSIQFMLMLFRGEWQNGLRIMFRDRYIYDIDKFDNSLFERKDLQWIKESYLIVLQMAWDREFYDRFTGKYTYPDVIKKGIELFGKIDVFGIWPTWPRLGLDQRNQWDMYRDLPGGTEQLRSFIKMSQLGRYKVFYSL